MKIVEIPGIDLCDFCSLDEDKRGVHGGPNGPIYMCGVSGCEEAYANYLDEVEGVEMTKYRKKPLVIEAIKLRTNNIKEVEEFIGDKKIVFNCDMSREKFEEYKDIVRNNGLKVKTLEGEVIASIGDYIIKGVIGEFYPCKPDVFKKTYEKVESEE